MADDREILREVWDGKVPICFSLATEEVGTVEQPDSYYVSSRIRYAPKESLNCIELLCHA